jgi:hypothetical protein
MRRFRALIKKEILHMVRPRTLIFIIYYAGPSTTFTRLCQ